MAPGLADCEILHVLVGVLKGPQSYLPTFCNLELIRADGRSKMRLLTPATGHNFVLHGTPLQNMS